MSVPEGAAKAPFANVGDIEAIRNRSLITSSDMPVSSRFGPSDGAEQSVAQGGSVVIYTTNFDDAISFDNGYSFSELDPTTAFGGASAPAGGFCCDQVVTYLPRLKRFVWVLQYRTGRGGSPSPNAGNVIRVATATLKQLIASRGTDWGGYDLTPETFGLQPTRPRIGKRRWPALDRPHLATTAGYVYMTVDAFRKLPGTSADFISTIIMRAPVRNLGGKNLGGKYVRVPGDYGKVRPAQNASRTAQTQYFAGTPTTTRLAVFKSSDDSDRLSEYDVDVPPIATDNTSSLDPADSNWMSRWGKQAGNVVTGAKVGSALHLGWMFGRWVKVTLSEARHQPPEKIKLHRQPGIGFATINTAADPPRLAGIDEIEYDDFAAALPQLRASTDGQLALSFIFGGPTRYASHVVGFLDPYAAALSAGGQATPLEASLGGDYVGLANIPGTQCFAAAGAATKLGFASSTFIDPHFVVFGRKAAHCTVPPPIIGPPGPPPPLPGPDLIVDFIGGGFGSITITVKNQGNQPAGASKLAYNVGGADQFADIAALNPGQTDTATVPCPRAGGIDVKARADATDVVTEADESNNGSSAIITCHLSRPDLVVTAVRFTPEGCCEIFADVANIGNADAPATVTRITQTGQASVDVATPPLAAGTGTTVKTQCVYGMTAEATATADINDDVLELDEGNNSNSGSGGLGGLCRFN